MKIVLLERNSAGTDVPVDCFYELGEVTSYPNTVTVEYGTMNYNCGQV